MTLLSEISFSDNTDLSDWLLLLNARGEIACEVWISNTTEAFWFTVNKNDLKTPSTQDLVLAIKSNFKQALISPKTRSEGFIPTIIGFTSDMTAERAS